MIIRKAVLKDSKHITRVQVESWQTTYKGIIPDEYLDSMTVKNREPKWKGIIVDQTVFIAEKDHDIIGFCHIGESTDNYSGFQGELFSIYLLRDYQGQGIGRQLFNKAIKEFKQKGIDAFIVKVLEQNQSLYFYEKLGAKHIDTIEINILGKNLKERIYGWEI